MSAKCTCPGALCSCGAEGIVKDGYGVRRSVMAMDGAISGEKHTGAPVIVTDSDRAYAEMKARDAAAWSGGAPNRITPELIADKGPEYARGLNDGAYEAMKARDAEGWRGAA